MKSPGTERVIDPGFTKTTPIMDNDSKNPKKKKYDEKRAKLENFLHNYLDKLERLLRPLKDKAIYKKYKHIAEEYFKRLGDDTLIDREGFEMGEMTIELMNLSNYVLDTVDITEMKKAGVLKTFLLEQIRERTNKKNQLE